MRVPGATNPSNGPCSSSDTEYNPENNPSCPQFIPPVNIPNVVGMTLTNAESAIQQAFAHTGNSGSGPSVTAEPEDCDSPDGEAVPQSCDDPQGEWTVTEQSPEAGSVDVEADGYFTNISLDIVPPGD